VIQTTLNKRLTKQGGGAISLETCTKGNSKQAWSFLNSNSIACQNYCIDIKDYKTSKGASVGEPQVQSTLYTNHY
jgi:hypothetical protein